LFEKDQFIPLLGDKQQRINSTPTSRKRLVTNNVESDTVDKFNEGKPLSKTVSNSKTFD